MAMTLHEALVAALEDEYRARATYRAVLDGTVRSRRWRRTAAPSMSRA